MVNIEIDPAAGFCFGVDKVIGMAESMLRKGEKVYTLGEMIHNREEMKRLHSLGMITVDHRELVSVKPESVLLRAHGEPPSTYRLAEKFHIKVIDGTCPIVLQLHKRIRQAYQAMDHDREQLVIFGKPDHPETISHLGQLDGDAVVISSPEEASKVDPGKRVILFSQTTMDPERFGEVEKKLKEHLLRSECTICGQMKKRKPELAAFARKHDLMLFVSGRHSSNGKMLYEFCKSVNPATHWISHAGEIDPAWLEGTASVGVSGATSTSREQLESVVHRVRGITRS